MFLEWFMWPISALACFKDIMHSVVSLSLPLCWKGAFLIFWCAISNVFLNFKTPKEDFLQRKITCKSSYHMQKSLLAKYPSPHQISPLCNVKLLWLYFHLWNSFLCCHQLCYVFLHLSNVTHNHIKFWAVFNFFDCNCCCYELIP